MQRGFRRVAGLGEGKRLRKSIDLSLRHPNTQFVAVEKANLDQLTHFGYLRERGAKVVPNNLTIKTGIAAEKYLAKEKANSFDHLYAHFLTQHLSYVSRQTLFREAWRTLKPGTKFAIIDTWAFQKPLEMELRNAGFGVSARRATAEELMKLRTDNGDRNVQGSIKTREFLELLNSMTPAQAANFLSKATNGKTTTVKQVKDINEKEVKELYTSLFTKYNGANPSQEAKNAHKLVLRSIRGEDYFQKPFVVIMATKPKARES